MDVKRLNVYIDELVLKGIKPEDANKIAATLSEDLQRQLVEQEAVQFAARGSRPGGKVGSARIPEPASSSRIATLLARLIAQRMRA
jgi:hypothetical protein